MALIALSLLLPQHSQKSPHSRSERSGVGKRGGIGAGGGTRFFLDGLVLEYLDDALVASGWSNGFLTIGLVDDDLATVPLLVNSIIIMMVVITRALDDNRGYRE